MQNNVAKKKYTFIEFSIMASSDKSIKLLEYNEPFYDIVMPNSDKMYEIHVDPTMNYLIINRRFINA